MRELDEAALAAAIMRGARAARVVVAAAQGSVPRDAGTWMAVVGDDRAPLIGTIGGGRLEHDAIAHARDLLAGRSADAVRRYPLGPSLGQCCGGVVDLRFELHDGTTLDALHATLARKRHDDDLPVALFGGGHVGRALARALAPLPVRLHWIDSRDEVFPDAGALGLVAWPPTLRTEHSDPVQRAVTDLEPQSRVVIMSFSHAEDFDIVVACLQRLRAKDDLPFIGLIGSKTKWATFRHRLEARGFAAHELARVTCPIGDLRVPGKEPAVIAAGVAAQLLATRVTN